MFKSTNRRCVTLLAAAFLLVAVPGAARSDSAQELFERAETLYRQLEVVDPSGLANSWVRVVDAFGDVAERYPESPLASEALWRMSFIYGRQERAGDVGAGELQRDLYRRLVQRYPDSPHAPEAMLRMAILAEDEEGTEAATLYTRLLQGYPSTPQASLARNRLAEAKRSNARLAATPGSQGGTTPGATPGATPATRPGSPRATSGATEQRPVRPLSPAPADAADEAAFATLSGIRHYSDPAHTRVVLDLDRVVRYRAGEAHGPERLFIDLQGVDAPAPLNGATPRGREQVIPIDSGVVSRLRVALNQPGIVRVVVDLSADSPYTLFTLDNGDQPFRIVIDVPTTAVASRVKEDRRPPAMEGGSLSEQLGLGIQRIVIDPGHGGTDPGAIGRTGVTEKQLTLQLSRSLAGRLRASGYDVMLTRETDETVSLGERSAIANRLDGDLFISIHVNSARNRKLRGFETYYLDLANEPTARETAARENAADAGGSLGHLDDTLEQIVRNEFQGASSELASSIQDSLVMHVAKNYQEVHDLGVKTAPFLVLVGARMPAVLVEASFVSNPQEETWLKSSDYRGQLAEAIEIGLQSYVEKRRVTATTGQ